MPSHPPFLCVGAAHRDLVARAGTVVARGADVPGLIEERPGGVALNLALALAGLGRPVALFAAIGGDGDDLLGMARAAGIDCGAILRRGTTDRYLAIEDAAGELVAAVADTRCLDQSWRPCLQAAIARATHAPATLVLDGNLPAAAFAQLPPGVPVAAVAASPAKATALAPLLGRPQTTLYLNRKEAEMITGTPLGDSAAAATALAGLGAARVLVTDGACRAAFCTAASCTEDGPAHDLVTALPASVAMRSVTGAGDRLVAAHLAAVQDGTSPETALRAGLAAAARHIGRAAS